MKHYDTERASTIAVDGDAVTITVRYDGGAWVAEYVMRGRVIDDSEKIWHPEMPRRRNAVRGAMRIARRYARMQQVPWWLCRPRWR